MSEDQNNVFQSSVLVERGFNQYNFFIFGREVVGQLGTEGIPTELIENLKGVRKDIDNLIQELQAKVQDR